MKKKVSIFIERKRIIQISEVWSVGKVRLRPSRLIFDPLPVKVDCYANILFFNVCA